ncbi:hypothetical protein [Bergeyella sp. RCAD1439]|uniref:hypothetical protein n=1 Tax=Bergeyella anatis TaxID=3113737 RepID=UPI002E18EF43|nr:hypothetical protein [Bergeyella sp. RCAD1439]
MKSEGIKGAFANEAESLFMDIVFMLQNLNLFLDTGHKKIIFADYIAFVASIRYGGKNV